MNIAAFRRKLFYIIAIVVLLLPVYLLGQPMIQRKGETISAGGTLAKIRQRYSIGQADLGEIDPASESMRLATLGLRGFATTILWHKADYYKREMFWDRYSATLNQIALLQPHFINVWDHQAHNLTYNIAVEFDGYKQRYEWVKKGIDYLIRGTMYNKRQPILQWTLGIYTGQKIGVADEKRQYREMYRNDDEYHKHLIAEGLDVKQSDALGADGKPDHWLSGRLWFLKAYDLVDAGYYCKKSPHLFYSDGPKCRLRYSEAIEEEGVLDDRAQFAWNRGGIEWQEFGNRDLLTTWGHTIKMKGEVAANAAVDAQRKEFDELLGDVRKSLLDKIRNSLTDEQKVIFDMPITDRTPEQQGLLMASERPLEPTPLEVAEAAPRNRRDKALQLASKLKNAEDYLSHTLAYRNQVNYEYWETRAISEQHKTTLTARQQMFNADKLLSEAKLDDALAEYDRAWSNWSKVFRRFPALMNDDIAGDIMKSIRRYKRILDSDFPPTFPLAKFYQFRQLVDKGGMDFETSKWFDRLKAEAAKRTMDDDDVGLEDIAPPPEPKPTPVIGEPTTSPPPESPKSLPSVDAPDAGTPPEPVVSPATSQVASPDPAQPPAPDGTVKGKEESSKRPPTLENPDPIQ